MYFMVDIVVNWFIIKVVGSASMLSQVGASYIIRLYNSIPKGKFQLFIKFFSCLPRGAGNLLGVSELILRHVPRVSFHCKF